MLKECKKLVTNIGRKANLSEDIEKYAFTLEKQYNLYSMVKMCMNLYTMKSMLEDANENGDVNEFYKTINELVGKYIVKDEKTDSTAIETIDKIRRKIEFKMKNLTAYTDAIQIYEYILNRVEAKVKGTVEAVDIDQLVEEMFSYVFMEDDTVVINSKLQLIMEQLPVRMIKSKFYDVVTNTLTIYKGGERQSVDEFVQMLKEAVLIAKPEGFETEYPALYEIYTNLKIADYANLDEENFDRLSDSISRAAGIINDDASCYMLLQEIVNDVYAILLTNNNAKEKNISANEYSAALAILSDCITDMSIDELNDKLMPKFIALEGAQENTYETIMVLETAFDDLYSSEKDLIAEKGLSDVFETERKVSKLLSSSLFIDLDKEDVVESEIADNDYIMQLRDSLVEDLGKLFADNPRTVNRSIMCKVIASMPIFLNTQQEIKNYFEYVLTNCRDDSELTACAKLLRDVMEEKE